MPWFFQWTTGPQCVWVCIKTCEVSVSLLMTAPVLQGPWGLMTSGNCDPRLWPLNLTCGGGGITSGEAGHKQHWLLNRAGCTAEDSHSDSRWSAADDSHWPRPLFTLRLHLETVRVHETLFFVMCHWQAADCWSPLIKNVWFAYFHSDLLGFTLIK